MKKYRLSVEHHLSLLVFTSIEIFLVPQITTITLVTFYLSTSKYTMMILPNILLTIAKCYL